VFYTSQQNEKRNQSNIRDTFLKKNYLKKQRNERKVNRKCTKISKKQIFKKSVQSPAVLKDNCIAMPVFELKWRLQF